MSDKNFQVRNGINVNGTVVVDSTLSVTANNLTANNATNLGGTAASGYQTTAGLSANVATLTANAAGYLGNSSCELHRS